MLIPIIVFVIAYVLIAFTKVPKSLVAMMGAAAMVLLGLLDSHDALGT